MAADGSVSMGAIADGRFLSANEVNFIINFPVEMRATPSIYQVTGNDYFKCIYAGFNQYVDGNWTLQYTHKNGTSQYGAIDSTGTADKPLQILFNNTSARLGYTAEL